MSEQGLERQSQAIVDAYIDGAMGQLAEIGHSLVAALRQARADLQEARGLLERAAGWIDEPEYTNHIAEDARRLRQRELLGESRAFLSRTAPREGE